jgi:hypothetical protein
MRGVLTPKIELWSFGSLGGLPNPHFGSVNFILTLSQDKVATNNICTEPLKYLIHLKINCLLLSDMSTFHLPPFVLQEIFSTLSTSPLQILKNHHDYEFSCCPNQIWVVAYWFWDVEDICRNRNLELATKARVCKGAGQEWSPRITFHVLRSARECERMNPHTPKWVPTLGVGVPMDSWNFEGQLQGPKFIVSKNPLHQ